MLADADGKALMTDEQRSAREKMLAKYMKKNEKKIVTWMKRNKGLKPPIFFDIEKNAFYWGEPDRQLKKQFNKEKRRLKNEVTDHILNPDVKSDSVGHTGSIASADTGCIPIGENKTPNYNEEGKVINHSDFQRLKEKTRSQILRPAEANGSEAPQNSEEGFDGRPEKRT